MSTSLKQQLRRIAAPQTDLAFKDALSRDSILFDSKEAATKSRRTIYDIGLAGLQELIALNPVFMQFEKTLFSEDSLNLERAVETSDVNDLLNQNIVKFLRYLSPYLLLRPAHMCLEWLLRRFQIHTYNRSDVVALILPYHETNVFVLMLQTLYLKGSDKDWSWLRKIQKHGVHLPKSAIINRAATVPAFYKFICNTTLNAVQELDSMANQLQAQLNFFTSVIVGALQNAQPVLNWHVFGLIESLIKGLDSKIIDFVSAAYIITAQLVSRTALRPKLCNAIAERVANCCFEELRNTAVLLLILIYDTQSAAKPQLKPDTLLHLIKQKWLTNTLATLAKQNIATQRLCEPLLISSVQAIQENHAEAINYKMFLERLLFDIEFSKSSAIAYINAFLDAYIVPIKENKIHVTKLFESTIVIDSDDEMIGDVSENFESWYSDYLFKLERQYPEAFDSVIKAALQQQNNANFGNNRQQAVKLALRYRLKSVDENTTSVYESLYHYTTEIRFHAVETLLHKLYNKKLRDQNSELFKECLADRINDDSELIVEKVLELPTDAFVDIMGIENFTRSLFNVMYKTQILSQAAHRLLIPVVHHLTNDIVINNYDNNLLLLALMPVLFPTVCNKLVHKALLKTLESNISKKYQFLSNLHVTVEFEEFSALDYKQHFLQTIAEAECSLKPLELLQSMSKMSDVAYLQCTDQVKNLIILITGCLKQQLNAHDSLQIYKYLIGHCQNISIRHSAKNAIPLEMYANFVVKLTRVTNFGNLQDWHLDEHNAALSYCLCIFDALSAQVFELNKLPEEKLEWMTLLKTYLDIVLPEVQKKLEFFLNFYLYETIPIVYYSAELRMRAIKLLQCMLQNKQYKFQLNAMHIWKIACALSSISHTMRLQTLETYKLLIQGNHMQLSNDLKEFVLSILAREDEQSMDSEQFALILFTILNAKKATAAQKMHLAKLQYDLLQLIVDTNQPPMFVVSLLKSFKHINNAEVFETLLPLALKALKQTKSVDQVTLLCAPYNEIYQLIIERIEAKFIKDMLNSTPLTWQIIEESLNAFNVYTTYESKPTTISCVLLATLTQQTVEFMLECDQNKLLTNIVKVVEQSKNDSIFLAAHKLLKKCKLDCEQLVMPLMQICQQRIMPEIIQKTRTAKQRKVTATPQLNIDSTEWKQGIVLLELLEHKKLLQNSEKLIPALFELLKVCMEVEQQNLIEYPKQLILSMLLHCYESTKQEIKAVLPESSFRVELIVQCLRTTQNPQTQQNSLLLLTHCAQFYPQKVLLNVVAIFTFVGSSLMRHDDVFSLHIINNIIESIVPILVQKRLNENAIQTVPVLKVFSDIMLDVPEHRRLPLYIKFLETLGSANHLWQFLCVIFEAHVLENEKQRLLKDATETNTIRDKCKTNNSRRLDIAQQLTNSFASNIIIETCVQLLSYLQRCPDEANEQVKLKNTDAETTELVLFDVKTSTPKQIRHFKYITMQFISSISSSEDFLTKIAQLSDQAEMDMKPYYQNFIMHTLSYVQAINNNQLKEVTGKDDILRKFWRVMLHHAHDILDNAIVLLSPDMFVLVICNFMQNELLCLRKKVIELLISKLQQDNEYFKNCNCENLMKLFKQLGNVVNDILTIDTTERELVLVQQTALIAIKMFSKIFGIDYIEIFKSILKTMIQILKERIQLSQILRATVMLTVIEVATNIRAQSLPFLSKFMPHVLHNLRNQAELLQTKPPDSICVAYITGVHKVFDVLANFLHPYLVDMLQSLTIISVRIKNLHKKRKKNVHSDLVQSKISDIWTRIASTVELRAIVPSCERTYQKLLEAQHYDEICVLMQLLLAAIKQHHGSELVIMQNELSAFCLQALAFRQQMQQTQPHITNECISVIETHIIDTFTAWILKLSENIFRPLHAKLHDWALNKQHQCMETELTYFRLTTKIAEALKSLFVLFADEFLEDAARLLNDSNSYKQAIESSKTYMHIELIRAILSTLYYVFLHNNKDFINAQKFNMLMQPIVDQLENTLVLEHEELSNIIINCIAQFALAVSNDMLWKQLNYQVLLKTHADEPEKRILAFNCSVEIARKLGEDFTALLPETVPFIAELLEDENTRVEKNTKRAVQELEQILGESLQKYF